MTQARTDNPIQKKDQLVRAIRRDLKLLSLIYSHYTNVRRIGLKLVLPQAGHNNNESPLKGSLPESVLLRFDDQLGHFLRLSIYSFVRLNCFRSCNITDIEI